MNINFDTSKNLNQLENVVWGEPEYTSGLVIRCHKLRTKKVEDFTTEDLRLMIGQNIGSYYLVPFALRELNKNPLAEGNYYEGDLLENILKLDCEFWSMHTHFIEPLKAISNKAISLLETTDNTTQINASILKSISAFNQCVDSIK